MSKTAHNHRAPSAPTASDTTSDTAPNTAPALRPTERPAQRQAAPPKPAQPKPAAAQTSKALNRVPEHASSPEPYMGSAAQQDKTTRPVSPKAPKAAHPAKHRDPLARAKPASPQPSAAEAVIAVHKVHKTYRMEGGHDVHALRGLSLRIARGDYVAIMGPSGSGKSTLLQILGCLDSPTQGSYRLAGEEVAHLSEKHLSVIRNQRIGFIFQAYNLLPRSSVLDNVALPLMYRGLPQKARRERALEALERVAMADRIHHRPPQLSGGQKQRVAVARALATDPDILLADEPTGALDSKTGAEILELFAALHSEGRTIIIVTHDYEVASGSQRIVHIRDGLVERIEARRSAAKAPAHSKSADTESINSDSTRRYR